MGNKLSTIVETIEVLVAEMNAFGLKHQLEAPPTWKEWRETDHNINDPEKIVSRSRDQEREKIVEILLNGKACSDGDLMVLPIVGMGGLGKTTLAQLIYNDPRVQEHFQLRKWVCVSDDFNVRNLANEISNASETSLEEALNKLQDELKGKRYLLVLDDVWNKDVNIWEKLKACLKLGGVGSAILTTTRDKEIAEFMGTIVDNAWTNKYHELSILGKEFIEEIIETRAFSVQGSKRDELVNLVSSVAERCAGSPLAAKALGSVLRNKTTKQEWEDVLQRSSICNDETGILPILKLSYNDLPSNMRQCFAFCAMYPKDYLIDVNNLIQLWMANGFISDKKKVPAETVGEQIIKEMVSRSFFEYVDLNRYPTMFGYSSINVLKIHDLMHDVAVSASEKECVYLTDEIDQSNELLPSAVRHIHYPEPRKHGFSILFDSLSRVTTPIQTLVIGKRFTGRVKLSSKHISLLHSPKYSSLRALSFPKLRGHHYTFTVKPKHLHHLRYRDLSWSEMEEVPDDISILYNLQTLKLSGCRRLRRLPKQMKYMTALRHLYTDRCDKLMDMPPKLGSLTSLQTITCFVVGSGKDCSGLGELKDLNIGGSLELKQLENVAKAISAKSANLGKKKELRLLSLAWTHGKGEEKQCHDEVLEALEAHDKLLALKISSYQGNRFPPWMGMLRNMVELQLFNCKKTEKLPLLCQLPELQFLHLEGLRKLQSLCRRCTSTTFGKLKDLTLHDLDGFDRFFCDVAQGEVVAFPQLEILCIEGCKSLKALPEAAEVLISETHGGGDHAMARSAFPRLKSLTLADLHSFETWEAADGLEIKAERPLVLFPLLEQAHIERCPRLMTLPRAHKLRNFVVSHGKEDMPTLEVDGNEERSWDHMPSVTVMSLHSCDGFFLGSRALLALWACFGQLQDLTIGNCHELVYWPEKEFRGLVSLRTLMIQGCKKLVGYAAHAATDEQATTSEEERRRLQLLPRLESLGIEDCESLVEILSAPALKGMSIEGCGKIESLLLYGKQQDRTQPSLSLTQHQGGSSTDDVTASTASVQEELSLPASTSQDNLLLPLSSLEILHIYRCDGLSGVLSLPPSLKGLYICKCPELRSLESTSGLTALESLCLVDCKSLASLPSGPLEFYSSLRKLEIRKCPGIKSLPSALQQRLDSLEKKDLDARLEAGGLLGRLCSRLSASWLR